MDTGGLAQMPSANFASQNGLGMPTSGLASRRGGQSIKHLAFDTLKPLPEKDNGAPTPRTSRSHLLAGLRTAPKSATAATFPASPTTAAAASQSFGANGNASQMYGNAQEHVYNGPKTALPRYAGQQQTFNSMAGGIPHHYTADQVLAPPEIQLDEQIQEQMDPNLYAQLVATNMYLAQQQQQLQQQLLSVQAAARQFQGINLSQAQQQLQQQQQYVMYQQQQQLKSMQQSLVNATVASQQPSIYAYYDPMTGQQTYFLDQSQAQLGSVYVDQAQVAPVQGGMQHFQQNGIAPRVQVSPPPENPASTFRSNSPPKRYELAVEPTPLPPPSANAFRRGHKKCASLANVNNQLTISSAQEPPKSAGPKTASFPLTPLTGGGYGPGQARAGEHPIRQPRGPPSFDELASKPTAKFEGSKNFAARTRRSAVHNLVRAGLERRKGTGSSSGSMSPVSESAEESGTPITDNESDSGHSGSGSLSGDLDCSLASSRTSTSGWGAIGSERPGSRQKTRKSVDSVSSATSACESDSSFASVFKNGGQRVSKSPDHTDGQRKAPRLVLTSAEKRKSGVPVIA